MKILATNKEEQDQALIDPRTVVHFGVGLAAGLMKIGPGWAIGGAVGYEVVEHAIQSSDLGEEIFSTPGAENIGNAVTDVAIYTLGWWLGKKWME